MHVPKKVDDSQSRFREEDLWSDDDRVRAKALRRLCPCHGSYELYDRYYDVIRALQKDPSPRVRAVALHLEEDAFVLESMESRRERSEEALEQRR